MGNEEDSRAATAANNGAGRSDDCKALAAHIAKRRRRHRRILLEAHLQKQFHPFRYTTIIALSTLLEGGTPNNMNHPLKEAHTKMQIPSFPDRYTKVQTLFARKAEIKQRFTCL